MRHIEGYTYFYEEILLGRSFNKGTKIKKIKKIKMNREEVRKVKE